jgi:signal transduction histidine kinase
VAATLATLACLELATLDPAPHPGAVFYAVAVAMGLALAVRRVAPVTTVVSVAVLFAVEPLTLGRAPEVLSEGVIMMVAAYSVAVHAPRGRSLAGLALLFGIALLRGLVEPSVDVEVAFIDALWVFPAFGVGWLVRGHERRAVTADLRAELAAETERLRIARELHDIVAHGIGVMVLHARGGRRNLDTDPEASREAFDTITSVGEGALAEMRRALGVLRFDGDHPDRTPVPGLAALPELLDTFRGAGLRCTAEIGELPELPAGLQLSVYRIVQECLTNSARHGGVAARVRLASRDGDLSVEVVDRGGGQDLGRGTSNGLAGIRERAEMFGGTLVAGPLPQGGHRVVVTIPLQEA